MGLAIPQKAYNGLFTWPTRLSLPTPQSGSASANWHILDLLNDRLQQDARIPLLGGSPDIRQKKEGTMQT